MRQKRCFFTVVWNVTILYRSAAGRRPFLSLKFWWNYVQAIPTESSQETHVQNRARSLPFFRNDWGHARLLLNTGNEGSFVTSKQISGIFHVHNSQTERLKKNRSRGAVYTLRKWPGGQAHYVIFVETAH